MLCNCHRIKVIAQSVTELDNKTTHCQPADRRMVALRFMRALTLYFDSPRCVISLTQPFS